MRYNAKIGDIQIDKDESEWVVIGLTHNGISRVRRDSLAHEIHAQSSSEIAKTLSSKDTPFKNSQ